MSPGVRVQDNWITGAKDGMLAGKTIVCARVCVCMGTVVKTSPFILAAGCRRAYAGIAITQWAIFRFIAANWCTDGGEVWRNLSRHIGARVMASDPHKLYILRDCCKFFRLCGQFHFRLTVLIWETSPGFPELWRFNLEAAFSPKFWAPQGAKLYVGCETVFEVQSGPDVPRWTCHGGRCQWGNFLPEKNSPRETFREWAKFFYRDIDLASKAATRRRTNRPICQSCT